MDFQSVTSVKNAKTNIKIVQQAIYQKLPVLEPFPPLDTINGNIMDALVYSLMKNVQVDIITSSPGGGYGSQVSSEFIYTQLLQKIINNGVNEPVAIKQLDQYLKIGEAAYKKGGKPSKNHSKFWMVDDEIFYVGSHNFYPSPLHQFGVIVESKEASEIFNKVFFEPILANAKIYKK